MRPEESLTSDAMPRAPASGIESASRGDTVASRRRTSSPAVLARPSQRAERCGQTANGGIRLGVDPRPPFLLASSRLRAHRCQGMHLHEAAAERANRPRGCFMPFMVAHRVGPSMLILVFLSGRHHRRPVSRAKSRTAHHEGAGTARDQKAKEFPAERCREASGGIARVAPRRGARTGTSYRCCATPRVVC